MPEALPISDIQCDLPPESANATPGLAEPPKLAPPAAQPPCELELLKLAAPRDYLPKCRNYSRLRYEVGLIYQDHCGSANNTLLYKVSLFIRSKNLK